MSRREGQAKSRGEIAFDEYQRIHTEETGHAPKKWESIGHISRLAWQAAAMSVCGLVSSSEAIQAEQSRKSRRRDDTEPNDR